MHSCEAIQLSIDYIENNLDKNLSTKMLADMVGLSMFYYQRLFCRLVHKPVQEYICVAICSDVIPQDDLDIYGYIEGIYHRHEELHHQTFGRDVYGGSDG